MSVQLLEQFVLGDDLVLVGAAVDHAQHHRQQPTRGLPPAFQNLRRVLVVVLRRESSRNKGNYFLHTEEKKEFRSILHNPVETLQYTQRGK